MAATGRELRSARPVCAESARFHRGDVNIRVLDRFAEILRQAFERELAAVIKAQTRRRIGRSG